MQGTLLKPTQYLFNYFAKSCCQVVSLYQLILNEARAGYFESLTVSFSWFVNRIAVQLSGQGMRLQVVVAWSSKVNILLVQYSYVESWYSHYKFLCSVFNTQRKTKTQTDPVAPPKHHSLHGPGMLLEKLLHVGLEKSLNLQKQCLNYCENSLNTCTYT